MVNNSDHQVLVSRSMNPQHAIETDSGTFLMSTAERRLSSSSSDEDEDEEQQQTEQSTTTTSRRRYDRVVEINDEGHVIRSSSADLIWPVHLTQVGYSVRVDGKGEGGWRGKRGG